MNIGIIGSGMVGVTLAKGFLKYGYPTMISSRSAEKRTEHAQTIGNGIATGTPDETARFGELLVVAVKGASAIDALEQCGTENIAGKVVIDANNPIEAAPPDNGVLRYFSDLNKSLMEALQETYPEVRFVKAFSCVGNAHMVDPDFDGSKPTMFICGNDEKAKAEVTSILDTFGWDIADMGGVEAARAIEPLAMLWCIPLFTGGGSDHAFKLLRK